MLISTAAALLLISAEFDFFSHIAATFVFALYSSFIAGLFIYYYLQSATSRLVETLVKELPPESSVYAAAGGSRLETTLDSLPLMAPTLISTAGIFFLLLVIRQGPRDVDFFTFRIMAALILNILTICPILVFSRHFHKRRLKAIGTALEDMVERGDTTRRIPTDLGDEYAMTAHRINRAFDLFRLVLSQMESASGRLSGTVMSFSSQIRETVAATTQQASAVKEMVGTMDGSNQINRQIQDRAELLSGNARASHALVDEGVGKVRDTVLKIDEIKKANLQTLNEIGDLTEEISSIGEIIEIINNIANQTRIIAFNAELEASSAGAAGVSFRIVAEEIRRLANGTVESLVGIKGQVGQLQRGSDRLLTTSEDETVKIEEGMRLSGDLNDIFTRIRNSAESTSESSGGISRISAGTERGLRSDIPHPQADLGGRRAGPREHRISSCEVDKVQGLIGELERVLARFGYDRADTAERRAAMMKTKALLALACFRRVPVRRGLPDRLPGHQPSRPSARLTLDIADGSGPPALLGGLLPEKRRQGLEDCRFFCLSASPTRYLSHVALPGDRPERLYPYRLYLNGQLIHRYGEDGDGTGRACTPPACSPAGGGAAAIGT